MAKLMNNDVLKLIVCSVIFCGTNFGMEKQLVVSRVVQTNLYVEYYKKHNTNYYGYDYDNDSSRHILTREKINEYGSRFTVKDSINCEITSAISFKNCYLVRQDGHLYVKGGADYILSVNKKERNVLSPDLVPVQLSRAQIKAIILLIDDEENKVFVLDEYDHRLDIADVTRKVDRIVNDYSAPRKYYVNHDVGYSSNYNTGYSRNYNGDDGCIIS